MTSDLFLDFFPVSSIYRCLVLDLSESQGQEVQSFKNATCCGFLACPLPSPSQKELCRKYFSTTKHGSSALQTSGFVDSGIYCFTSRPRAVLSFNHPLMSTSVVHLIKMQKTLTTLLGNVTALRSVHMWVGMWGQRYMGCILFSRANFQCRVSDD